jgi:hypothetical protein
MAARCALLEVYRRHNETDLASMRQKQPQELSEVITRAVKLSDTSNDYD